MKKKGTVGVVVGRFQVPSLHWGHRLLLDHVESRHEHLLVVLGSSAMEGARRNPLGFAPREMLVKRWASSALVREIKDHPSDKAWSGQLDALIEECFPGRPAMLYGGRDSFVPRYHGRHRTSLFKSDRPDSGAEIRAGLLRQPRWECENFRAGVIYAAERLWPQLYMTVDIAVIDAVHGSLLLGRKHPGDGWCLPGGFVDSTDASLVAAASRELLEETGYEIDVGGEEGLHFVGSALVDDWRYKGPDRIMTALFVAHKQFGAAGSAVMRGSDDLAQIAWLPFRTAADRKAVREQTKPHHRPLLDMLPKTCTEATI